MAEDLARPQVVGAAELSAALKVAPAAMKRELRKAHKDTAREVQGWVRAAASSGTAQQRHMANAIKAESNSTQARLAVKPGARTGGALGAFYGAKQFKQFPKWVGNNWKAATRGQGPYVINDTLAKHEGDIVTIFEAGQMRALNRAFPGRK